MRDSSKGFRNFTRGICTPDNKTHQRSHWRGMSRATKFEEVTCCCGYLIQKSKVSVKCGCKLVMILSTCRFGKRDKVSTFCSQSLIPVKNSAGAPRLFLPQQEQRQEHSTREGAFLDFLVLRRASVRNLFLFIQPTKKLRDHQPSPPQLQLIPQQPIHVAC